MNLKKYQQKRDFSKTPEPKGKITNRNKALYLIQKHAASHLHYDLRLEMDGVLKSWAIPKGPSLDSRVKRLAIEVEDHPIAYGNFEGIIPKGQYGGGTVMLWDTGYFKSAHEPQKAVKKGDFTFEIKGKKLHGLWKLIKIRARSPHALESIHSNKNYWLFFKLPDKYEKNDYDVIAKKPLSVKTKRCMDNIAKAKIKKIWQSNRFR